MSYGLDTGQLRFKVIRPVLQRLQLWSQVAENLCLGTALQESRATYLFQKPNGPAMGIYQMEPATHLDIHRNFLVYQPDMKKAVIQYAGYFSSDYPDPGEMVGNLYYATAMCRVFYRRIKAALPPNDAQAMAEYYKQYFNTKFGKATVPEALVHFKAAMAESL